MSKQWIVTGVRHYPNGKREYLIFNKTHQIASVGIVEGSDGTEEKARADLIVTACNSHDALLEACKEVHDIINAYSHIPAMFKACQKLQAAISAAEKEEGK